MKTLNGLTWNSQEEQVTNLNSVPGNGEVLTAYGNTAFMGPAVQAVNGKEHQGATIFAPESRGGNGALAMATGGNSVVWGEAPNLDVNQWMGSGFSTYYTPIMSMGTDGRKLGWASVDGPGSMYRLSPQSSAYKYPISVGVDFGDWGPGGILERQRQTLRFTWPEEFVNLSLAQIFSSLYSVVIRAQDRTNMPTSALYYNFELRKVARGNTQYLAWLYANGFTIGGYLSTADSSLGFVNIQSYIRASDVEINIDSYNFKNQNDCFPIYITDVFANFIQSPNQ